MVVRPPGPEHGSGVNIKRKVKMSLLKKKPYDNQITDDTSIFYNNHEFGDEFEYWAENKDLPVVNVFVGFPKCGKSTYIEKCGLVGMNFPGIPMSDLRNSDNEDGRVTRVMSPSEFSKKRKLNKIIKNKESVIVDGENLTAKERDDILKRFPIYYKKIAVVWDLTDDELLERGCSQEELTEKRNEYERPDGNEGFDEFFYILS